MNDQANGNGAPTTAPAPANAETQMKVDIRIEYANFTPISTDAFREGMEAYLKSFVAEFPKHIYADMVSKKLITDPRDLNASVKK